nr:palmitoyl-protein thioesterase 1-like isoform X2 [Ipomoea batatas]
MKFIFTFVFILTLTTLRQRCTTALPFVVFHGISDKCSNGGISEFTQVLSNWSGSEEFTKFDPTICKIRLVNINSK